MAADDLSDGEARADGWDAIDEALEKVYGQQEPKHFGSILPMSLGGNEPLQGISVYVNDNDLPHWHYVTYGFSDLYEKESDDLETSGFGFELTFRLRRDPAADSPPPWPLNFLQNIARYVFRTGNCFAPNHHLDLGGPIALDQETAITGAAFILDPQLGQIMTKNGRLDFVQVVGLCSDEFELVKQWDCESLLKYLGEVSPLLVTDLARRSLLADEQRAKAIRSIAAAEGSSQGAVYGAVVEASVEGESLTIRIAASVADGTRKMFEGRLKHGKPFLLQGKQSRVAFEPAEMTGWRLDEAGLPTIFAGQCFMDEFLATVQVRRGVYTFESLPRLRLEVVASEIKDPDGNVIRVIG